MKVAAAFLRAINVGGRSVISMTDLRAVCEAAGFRDVRTLLQSGNVAFAATGTDRTIARKLADGIAASHGFRPEVVVRTGDELDDVVRRNPFPAEAKRDPGHLLVAFMAEAPAEGAKERLAAIKVGRERMILSGRELFIHYADGVGRSKVTNAVLERALGRPVTARNWNTVGKVLDLARQLEGHGRKASA